MAVTSFETTAIAVLHLSDLGKSASVRVLASLTI